MIGQRNVNGINRRIVQQSIIISVYLQRWVSEVNAAALSAEDVARAANSVLLANIIAGAICSRANFAAPKIPHRNGLVIKYPFDFFKRVS
jgi:hypothetical protein